MKEHLITLFWLILFGTSAYFSYNLGLNIYKQTTNQQLLLEVILCTFITGFSICATILNLIHSNTSESLNVYKRELEKESIDKTESSSRIKVLESKIQVLEKALDEAIKK